MGRARSWPCPLTTRGTSSSRRQFGLEIRQVVQETGKKFDAAAAPPIESRDAAFTGDGIAINSGLARTASQPQKQRTEIVAWLEQNGLGRGNNQLQIARLAFLAPTLLGRTLPHRLDSGKTPRLTIPNCRLSSRKWQDFKPTGTPEPPLSRACDWLNYSELARRETNTMPQWAGSCWYYLRFCDPKNTGRFVGVEAERYWMTGHPKSDPARSESRRAGGVDLYVGGTEHAVLHLLYARFWHKVLYDLGYLSTPEPFQRLVNQGVILGPDNQKMSKSRGNVVNPENVIAEYGADSLRLYEMFMGPLEQMKPWSMKGVEGVYRFLGRVWRLVMEETQEGGWTLSPEPCRDRTHQPAVASRSRDDQEGHRRYRVLRLQYGHFADDDLHQRVRQFEAPSGRRSAHLAAFAFAICSAHCRGALGSGLEKNFPDSMIALPHSAGRIYDEKFLAVDEVEYGVQVNGKVRDRMRARKDASDAELEESALAAPKVREAIAEGLFPRSSSCATSWLISLLPQSKAHHFRRCRLTFLIPAFLACRGPRVGFGTMEVLVGTSTGTRAAKRHRDTGAAVD